MLYREVNVLFRGRKVLIEFPEELDIELIDRDCRAFNTFISKRLEELQEHQDEKARIDVLSFMLMHY